MSFNLICGVRLATGPKFNSLREMASQNSVSFIVVVPQPRILTFTTIDERFQLQTNLYPSQPEREGLFFGKRGDSDGFAWILPRRETSFQPKPPTRGTLALCLEHISDLPLKSPQKTFIARRQCVQLCIITPHVRSLLKCRSRMSIVFLCT